MTQSYTNPGGSGNRSGHILVTGTFTFNGPIAALVNGTQVDEFWWNSGQSGVELRFDFGDPRCITEAKWYQANTSTHGNWKWQGSSNGTTWTDIGAVFSLGGATTQTITTLSGNTNFFRYYRLLNVSGSTSNSPYLREVEFAIDDTVVYVTDAQITQMALEQWVVPVPPPAQITQVALEQWASVAGAGFFSARHV
jgi:hypothetical protein